MARDAEDRVVRYDYDSSERLGAITNVLGHTRSYAYDDPRPARPQTDWNGNEITIGYDDAGRWIRTIGADGYSERAVYDQQRGRATFFKRGGAPKLLEYGPAGQRVAETDALGNRVEFGYDGHTRRINRREPDGTLTSQRYDSDGRMIESISPLGVVTSYDYDASGNLTRRVEDVGGLDAVWVFEYDEAGNRVRTIAPDGAETRQTYDAYGQLVAVLHPDGSTDTTEYDERGRIVRRTDMSGVVTRYEYDDPDGWRSIVRGDERQRIRLDAAGRPIARDDGASISSMDYDPQGNIVSVSDGLGVLMSATYDSNHRPVAMTDALGGTYRVVYDPQGNVLAQ